MSLVAAIAFLLNRDLTLSGWQSLNLTNAVIAWKNRLYSNNGVWIRGGSLVVNVKFAFSGDANSFPSDTTSLNHRPMLFVSYSLPVGATAPPSI